MIWRSARVQTAERHPGWGEHPKEKPLPRAPGSPAEGTGSLPPASGRSLGPSTRTRGTPPAAARQLPGNDTREPPLSHLGRPEPRTQLLINPDQKPDPQIAPLPRIAATLPGSAR